MLLHLCEDEKFIDHVIRVFEKVSPNNNHYFLEIPFEGYNIKYVKSNHSNITIATSDSQEFRKISNEIEKYRAVIVHNIFNPYKLELIKNTSEKVYFHWMVWGADLYGISSLKNSLYSKSTKEYINEKQNFKGKLGNLIDYYFPKTWNKFYLSKKNNNNYNDDIEIISRFKSCSTVIPDEVELVHKHISKKISYYPFKYATIEGLLGKDIDTVCNADDILLGNSATYSNNHIEAIEFLKKIDLEGRKIYIPLSYGDSTYADFIETKGKKIWGNDFVPLRTFIPLEDYNKIINQCGNVLMNHYRQQGLGNLIVSLWKGSKIFLNKKNLLCEFLISNGFEINSIEKLKFNQIVCEETIQNNRKLLKNIYGEERVLSEVENFIKKIEIS